MNSNGPSKKTKTNSPPNYATTSSSSASEPSTSSLPSYSSSSSATSPQTNEDTESSDEESQFSGLTEYLERLQLDPTTPRYHGNSAPDRMLKDVMGMKDRHTRRQFSDGYSSSAPTINGRQLRRRPEFWGAHPVRAVPIFICCRLTRL
jgi:hypothetical protein